MSRRRESKEGADEVQCVYVQWAEACMLCTRERESEYLSCSKAREDREMSKRVVQSLSLLRQVILLPEACNRRRESEAVFVMRRQQQKIWGEKRKAIPRITTSRKTLDQKPLSLSLTRALCGSRG